MTRVEHLLTILGEECAEVAQRASKAARFGLEEIQPEQTLTNKERIEIELIDLLATAEMLGIDCRELLADELTKAAKKQKVEKFLLYSQECGTLVTVLP